MAPLPRRIPSMKLMLSEALQGCLRASDPAAKADAVAALAAAWSAGSFNVGDPDVVDPIGIPGRPERPRLVRFADLPRRNPGSPEGRAALLHSLAHIEFNAINLALDSAYRFPGMPVDYYAAWIGVAAEEALHFSLLRKRLRAYGFDYGDFEAHDGLWEMARRSATDPLLRMALVPRCLEARGLDAAPPILAKLEGSGDHESARVLTRIMEDEVGHVAAGDRWFRMLCAQRGIDAESEFRRLLRAWNAPWPRGPLNEKARRAAGFSDAELLALAAGPDSDEGAQPAM